MGATESKLLEQEVARQRQRIADLEARLDTLETRLASTHTERTADLRFADRAVEGENATVARNPWMVGLPALVGRTIMVLGGAFFLRALTDSGALPPGAGVAAGIAYALAWVLLADRAARAGRAPDATAHGLATTLIAFPLVWETTTRFALLSPAVSAFTLTAVAGAVLGIAWFRRLGLLAWIVTLTATMTGVALLFATRSLPLFAVALFVLAIASLAASLHRKWYGLRWPAAIALDLLVVLAMYLIGKTNYEWLLPGQVATVQLLMTAIYLGIIGLRTIVLGHPTREFGIVQSLVVLIVGFEGARRVLGTEHPWATAFATVALVLAAAYYAAAFVRFEHDPRQRANWTWYLTLGTTLTIYSSILLIDGHVVGLPWALLAVVGAYLGRPDDRSAVRWNVTAIACASALGSGLAVTGFLAFFGADPVRWLDTPLTVWGTAALCLAAWILSRGIPAGGDEAYDRAIPALTLLAIGAVGVGTGLVTLVGPGIAGAGTDAVDTGALAVVRTAVVCASALAFAMASRVRRHAELVWAAYGALVVAACKIAVDDLPNGSAMTMFLSFILFGGVMIIAPRLVPDIEEKALAEEAAR